MPSRPSWIPCVLLLAAGGCVEVTQWTPPTRLFAGTVIEREAVEQRPFVGLTLEETIGSLDEMEFLVGLEVVEVSPGSPAESVGLEVGDLVIEADGVELLAVDQWQAVVDTKAVGDEIALLIERDSGLSETSVVVGSVGGEELPEPVRFVERAKARVELETVSLAEDGSASTGVRVVRLLPTSPWVGLIEVGERIEAIDGEPAVGARPLIDRIADLDYGAPVHLTVAGDDGARDVETRLWAPPRSLTRLQLPILFDYQHDPAESVTEFELIDLWLFSLYDYRRELMSRRHRILYFIEWSTGVGELTEVEVER